MFFCSQLTEAKPSAPGRDYERVADKATLVKALSESLANCDRVYAATTDANFNEPLTMRPGVGGGPASTVRGALLMFDVAHSQEHYGNAVVYLRLKGHVPPSTARAQHK